MFPIWETRDGSSFIIFIIIFIIIIIIIIILFFQRLFDFSLLAPFFSFFP